MEGRTRLVMLLSLLLLGSALLAGAAVGGLFGYALGAWSVPWYYGLGPGYYYPGPLYASPYAYGQPYGWGYTFGYW